LLEHADPIAAVAFGLMERGIGGAQERVFGAHVARRIQSDPD
jgi:hypothetical protein